MQRVYIENDCNHKAKKIVNISIFIDEKNIESVIKRVFFELDLRYGDSYNLNAFFDVLSWIADDYTVCLFHEQVELNEVSEKYFEILIHALYRLDRHVKITSKWSGLIVYFTNVTLALMSSTASNATKVRLERLLENNPVASKLDEFY
jgi:hypothetical protein